MSFPDRAESLRVKAHMSGTRLPVLVGITAIALLIMTCIGVGVAHTFASNRFVIEKSETVQSGREDLTSEQEQFLSEQENSLPSEASSQPNSMVVVHVGGAVITSGVYEIPQGSRVQDAVDAAGGFAEDAACDALNLARVLSDGEQVVVPTQEEYVSNTISPAFANTENTNEIKGKININTASAAELDTLPGIGFSTAEKIIADRTEQGLFASPEDLKRVTGIGEKKYAALADLICTG